MQKIKTEVVNVSAEKGEEIKQNWLSVSSNAIKKHL
jgi:hypothetical protein